MLFLPAANALEAMLATIRAEQTAQRWGEDFELIPSCERQN